MSQETDSEVTMNNNELLEKAKRANSPEELLALAEENDIDLDRERAKELFDNFQKSGELSDEELDNVSGGGCRKGGRLIVTVRYVCDHYECKFCGTRVTGAKFMTKGKTHGCSVKATLVSACCNTCKQCSYEKGMWFCNHPENTKN